jgi:hypothetical protein
MGNTVPHPSAPREEKRLYIFRGVPSSSLPSSLYTINPAIWRMPPAASVNPWTRKKEM